jgi:hypothetical protein
LWPEERSKVKRKRWGVSANLDAGSVRLILKLAFVSYRDGTMKFEVRLWFDKLAANGRSENFYVLDR